MALSKNNKSCHLSSFTGIISSARTHINLSSHLLRNMTVQDIITRGHFYSSSCKFWLFSLDGPVLLQKIILYDNETLRKLGILAISIYHVMNSWHNFIIESSLLCAYALASWWWSYLRKEKAKFLINETRKVLNLSQSNFIVFSSVCSTNYLPTLLPSIIF